MTKKVSFFVFGFGLFLLFTGLLTAAPKSPWQEITPVSPEPEQANSRKTVNRILALVTDEVITLGDYKKQYGSTEVEQEKLQLLIEKKLIRAAAEELKININNKDLQKMAEQRISRLKQAKGPSSYYRYLQEQNLSESEFKEELKKQAKNDRLINSLLNFAFPGFAPGDTTPGVEAPGQIRGRLMLFSDSETAHRALRQLNRGAAWSTLYDSYSLNFSFMGPRGNLGWFSWGKFASSIEYNLFKLPLYGVSEPFKFRKFYAIVHKTGSRVQVPGGEVSQRAKRTWAQYRFRHYREKLMSLLRERYTVIIPPSVNQRLADNGD